MNQEHDTIRREIRQRRKLQAYAFFSLAFALIGFASLKVIPVKWRVPFFVAAVLAFLASWALACMAGSIRWKIVHRPNLETADLQNRLAAGKDIRTIEPRAWRVLRRRGTLGKMVAVSFAIPIVIAIVLGYISGWTGAERSLIVFFPFPVSLMVALFFWQRFLKLRRRHFVRQRHFAKLLRGNFGQTSLGYDVHATLAADIVSSWRKYWASIAGLFAYVALSSLATMWLTWLAFFFQGPNEINFFAQRLLGFFVLFSPLGLVSLVGVCYYGPKLRRLETQRTGAEETDRNRGPE